VRAKLHAVKQRASALARKPNVRKAAVLTGLMYLSPALGLLLDNLLARHFGVGTTLDIFRLVTNFLMLGTGLVAGTLLKYAIIPELAKTKANDDLRSGLMFVSVLAGLVLALMLPLIGLGLFAPQWLLHLLGPGLPYLPEADLLVQVACVGFALMIISSAGGAVLQFYGTFWAQPAGQVALNSAVVLAISLFAAQAPTPAAQLQLLTYGLLAGVVGWIFIFAVLLTNLWRRELGQIWARTKRPTALRAIALAAIMALAPQLVIMGSEILKNILINRALTFAEPGSLTLYTFAFKMLMLAVLPILAITTILFPTLAKVSTKTVKDKNTKFNQQLSQLFILSVIFFIGLWLGAPIILKLLFGLANLSTKDTQLLLETFRILLLIIPCYTVSLCLLNYLYALRKIKAVTLSNCIPTFLLMVSFYCYTTASILILSYLIVASYIVGALCTWWYWKQAVKAN
jgi:peptidoglycan biosynthesis protein MviN/MurJ (putative lipid II flippase)